MAEIEIVTETEAANRWDYEVRVTDEGKSYDYLVSLSWSDYDLWSHGRVAPQRVVQAAIEFLLNKEEASSILARFDCSLIRRYFPEVDRELPQTV
jgi:hypothetical protein